MPKITSAAPVDPKKDPELVDMPNIDDFRWFYLRYCQN